MWRCPRMGGGGIVSVARVQPFRRNLLQTIGSSGVGFAITLITTPLMTRIFPADAYGVNGMLMTGATLLSALALLGLPVALSREQTGSDQARLLNASVQLAAILIVVCFIGVVLVQFLEPASLYGMTGSVLWLFPILVSAHAAQRISDALATARGQFPSQAAARIANAATARGLTLGMGWVVTAGAATMMLGDIAGKLAHVIVAAHGGQLHSVWRTVRWRPEKKFLSITLRDYRQFALNSNIASILPLLNALGVQALIGIHLGASATGQYVLAHSILSLPVSLIALSTAPVIFHRLIRIGEDDPASLRSFTIRVAIGYGMIGAILMLPLTEFGPGLFAFVFGEPWREAGTVAAVLCLPQIFSFSLTAILPIFRVKRRIRAWLLIELTGTLVVLGGFALLPFKTNLGEVVVPLAWLWIGYQVLMHTACFWAAAPQHELNSDR